MPRRTGSRHQRRPRHHSLFELRDGFVLEWYIYRPAATGPQNHSGCIYIGRRFRASFTLRGSTAEGGRDAKEYTSPGIWEWWWIFWFEHIGGILMCFCFFFLLKSNCATNALMTVTSVDVHPSRRELETLDRCSRPYSPITKMASSLPLSATPASKRSTEPDSS